MGAVLGSIIVIIILLVAAFYLWGNRPKATTAPVQENGVTAEEVQQTPDSQTTALETQSNNDNVSSIESDLNSTDLNNLTPEVSSIDQELSTQPK